MKTLATAYRDQYRWRAWHLVYEKLPLEAGQLVLDLGCAVGDQSAALMARGARVLGIDANPELLEAARSRGLSEASFVEADLRGWSDPALAADGLWSSFAAAFFPDFAPVLGRWVAALRRGAWVALVEVDEMFGHEPVRAATREKLASYREESLRLARYDFRMGRRLRGFASAAGLEVIDEFELPDQELSFSGAASAEVIAAWATRFERMKALRDFVGEDFEAVRDDFLRCLSLPEHRSDARVVGVVAIRK